jgi:hypothetical protein
MKRGVTSPFLRSTPARHLLHISSCSGVGNQGLLPVCAGPDLAACPNPDTGSASAGDAFGKTKILRTEPDVCEQAIVEVRDAPSQAPTSCAALPCEAKLRELRRDCRTQLRNCALTHMILENSAGYRSASHGNFLSTYGFALKLQFDVDRRCKISRSRSSVTVLAERAARNRAICRSTSRCREAMSASRIRRRTPGLPRGRFGFAPCLVSESAEIPTVCRKAHDHLATLESSFATLCGA